MRRLILSALASAAMASAMIASPANATITITTDQQTDQGDIVLLPVDQTGNLVRGVTQGGFSLDFTSTETITTPSNGQARIEGTDGSLNNITISATDGSMFEFIEFNLFGQQGFDGFVTITGVDQNNMAYSLIFGDDANENLGGENFFFAATDDLQSIQSISFTTSGGGFADIRQVRVGPGVTVGAVPEPGTWAMMLMGFGGMGFAMRRRRRTSLISQIA
jgi:hypothetical protein